MQIIRFEDPAGQTGFAALQGGEARKIEGDIFGAFQVSEQVLGEHRVLAPIVPAAIVCIGLNYKRHAQETGASEPEFPIVFLKPPSSVQHPGEPILLPRHLASSEVDYECELAVVIGRGPQGEVCKNASRDNALDYVLGYTGANDVSARDWQIKRGGGQWSRGKSFDTFCPLGPVLVLRDEIPDPNALAISTVLNGDVVQDWNTGDMIFDVPALIEFLSGSTTLQPGTVILTGTPHGVGMARKPPLWLRDGDTVSVEIEGIGTLSNPVRNE
jgi:2-keto-4-pentenoate hydratase/2-oxohepta-3-ene-1,7-dioic acid hydratase in catechol pathway